VYAEAYEQYGPSLEEGRCIVVEGQVMRRQDDEIQLAANKVQHLDAALPGLIKELTFVVDANGQTPDFLNMLRNEIESEMGSTRIKIGFLLDDEELVVADIAQSLTWTLRKDVFGRLRQHPAVRDVQLTVPEVEAPAPRWAKRAG